MLIKMRNTIILNCSQLTQNSTNPIQQDKAEPRCAHDEILDLSWHYVQEEDSEVAP